MTLRWYLIPAGGGRPGSTGRDHPASEGRHDGLGRSFPSQTTGSGWFTGQLYWGLSTTDRYGGTTSSTSWGPVHVYGGCLG